MSMDRLIPYFFDELEKIAVCVSHSSFMQSRKGRRPIRAHNVLTKETAFKAAREAEDENTADADDSKSHEIEYGMGMQGVG